MPQSLSAVFIHLVFSTKHRQPFLRDESLRNDLHSFLGGTSTFGIDVTALRLDWVCDKKPRVAARAATLGWRPEPLCG